MKTLKFSWYSKYIIVTIRKAKCMELIGYRPNSKNILLVFENNFFYHIRGTLFTLQYSKKYKIF